MIAAQLTFLILALCTATSKATDGIPFSVLDASSGPSTQKIPCILILQMIDYNDLEDTILWECKVFGGDAATAGAVAGSHHAMVLIEGYDLVSAAKSDIVSGVTTLYAQGATLANHIMTITNQNHLYFGVRNQVTGSQRRRLATSIGNLSVLAVRVTTQDASLSYGAAEMSDNIFGTHGDQINLKNTFEDCSNNAITINQASSESILSCDDDPAFGYAYDFGSGVIDCDYMAYVPDYYCPMFGNTADIGGSSLVANQACCACGGGTPTTINPGVNDGVIEISLPILAIGNSASILEEQVENELERIYNVNSMDLIYDLVMVCVPKGTFSRGSDEWVAYAQVGGFLSIYNGEIWCASPSTHQHEAGHNLGLLHSSQFGDLVNEEYGDQSGVMGYAFDVAEEGIFAQKSCFNGAHSWELGWYINDNLEINPLSQTYTGGLAGVGRLPGLASDEKIVLKLTNSQNDYYLIFNHAFGANEGTIEARNQVTITTRITGVTARTYLERALSAGEHFTVSNWDGTGQSVTIYVSDIDTSATGRADIEVFQGTMTNLPPPIGVPVSPPIGVPLAPPIGVPIVTSEPSNDPSSQPSKEPSTVPSAEPSTVPSAEPSFLPSPVPSRAPSSVPTLIPSSVPTLIPSNDPSQQPSQVPSNEPSTSREIEPPIGVPVSPPIGVPLAPPIGVPIVTSQPSNDPSSQPSKEPSMVSSINPVKQTEINGDPHFKTWKNEHFEYHGQCDIVMVSNPNFANGLGIDIHIRTKTVRFWSFIQRAVIRIGNDILEVEGSLDTSKVRYWINYELQGELEDLGGFPVSINDNKNRYVIDLDSLYPGEQIHLKTFKEFVGVKIIGASESSFGNSTGITGDFATGNTYARDGSTVLNDYVILGQEWQVLPSDGLYFREVSRPQFPEKCYVPEDPRGERQRRLVESSVTEEQAEAACSQLEDEFSRKGCIYDILATQDLDMVGAY